jgi:hypothetical protein
MVEKALSLASEELHLHDLKTATADNTQFDCVFFSALQYLPGPYEALEGLMPSEPNTCS